MNSICTLSNKRYLLQGIALCESISKHSNIPIYYLCLDEDTYRTINIISATYNIIPIHYTSLENSYPDILQLKNNFSEYCFSFSALLPLYIFRNYLNITSTIYVDSDTYFYHNVECILNDVLNYSVGVVRHRNGIDRNHPSGEYNCNVVYVKNNEYGIRLLDWWHIAFMTKTPVHLSTCGDQKYMEAFEDVIGKENFYVIDNIGHGAPWNHIIYDYSQFSTDNPYIRHNNTIQPFVFNHFSQFEYNFDNDTFIYSTMHKEYTRNHSIYKEIIPLHEMHQQYYNKLKYLNEIHNLNFRGK